MRNRKLFFVETYVTDIEYRYMSLSRCTYCAGDRRFFFEETCFAESHSATHESRQQSFLSVLSGCSY